MESQNADSILSELNGRIPDAGNLTIPEIVKRLVDDVCNGKTDWFQSFFDLVEHELIFAKKDVQNKLIVELLEGLKNHASLHDVDYAIFENWLGPETHVAWRWLEKKWQGKTSLADSASGL